MPNGGISNKCRGKRKHKLFQEFFVIFSFVDMSEEGASEGKTEVQKEDGVEGTSVAVTTKGESSKEKRKHKHMIAYPNVVIPVRSVKPKIKQVEVQNLSSSGSEDHAELRERRTRKGKKNKRKPVSSSSSSSSASESASSSSGSESSSGDDRYSRKRIRKVEHLSTAEQLFRNIFYPNK
jgi:hypothetical protein